MGCWLCNYPTPLFSKPCGIHRATFGGRMVVKVVVITSITGYWLKPCPQPPPQNQRPVGYFEDSNEVGRNRAVCAR